MRGLRLDLSFNDGQRTAGEQCIGFGKRVAGNVVTQNVFQSRDLARRFHAVGLHFLQHVDVAEDIRQLSREARYIVLRQRETGECSDMPDLVGRECHTLRSIPWLVQRTSRGVLIGTHGSDDGFWRYAAGRMRYADRMALHRLSGRKTCDRVLRQGRVWRGTFFMARWLPGPPRVNGAALEDGLYLGTFASTALDKSAVRRNRMRRRVREAFRITIPECSRIMPMQLLVSPKSASLNAPFDDLQREVRTFFASLPSAWPKPARPASSNSR